MTEQDKVTVDDIIGIVKTEEPTDSVALKKEAQLSICEKRLIELEKENEQLRTKNNAYIQDIEVFKEENTHLKLKNDQLKHSIKCLEADKMELQQYIKRMQGDVE